MKKVTAFDRRNVQEVSALVQAKLREVEEQTGVAFKLGNVRFDSGQFTTKVIASVKDHAGETVDGAAAEFVQDYERNRGQLGLPANLIGVRFSGMGGEYVFVGTRARNRKYPVIARKPTGGLVKMTVNAVMQGLPKNAKK